MVMSMTNNITIPALYSVNSAQPDSRQISITVNALYDGICFGKCLFSCDSIENSKETLQDIPILTENSSCAVGTISEGTTFRWKTLKFDGVWRNYLQFDALLWSKLEDRLPTFSEKSTKFYEIELNLSEITGNLQENGDFCVTSFRVDSCCLLDSQSNNQTTVYTRTDRYGRLPPKINKAHK